MMCTMVWGGFFAFCEYLSCARRLSLTLWDPLNIILTSLLSGIWLVFPPNIGVFYLHGWALLATGLMFACGLATTLSIVVCCNITIRPESIHCTLVAGGVKYVCILATTLGVAVRCNTAITLEFVRYMLMTCGHMFFCCSATTLGIVVHCDIAIRPKSVHYVLAIIKLLTICRAHLR